VLEVEGKLAGAIGRGVEEAVHEEVPQARRVA
jgi:hypothetical protein